MKTLDSEMEVPVSNTSDEFPDLGALDGHVKREFADRNLDATMETMVPSRMCTTFPT